MPGTFELIVMACVAIVCACSKSPSVRALAAAPTYAWASCGSASTAFLYRLRASWMLPLCLLILAILLIAGHNYCLFEVIFCTILCLQCKVWKCCQCLSLFQGLWCVSGWAFARHCSALSNCPRARSDFLYFHVIGLSGSLWRSSGKPVGIPDGVSGCEFLNDPQGAIAVAYGRIYCHWGVFYSLTKPPHKPLYLHLCLYVLSTPSAAGRVTIKFTLNAYPKFSGLPELIHLKSEVLGELR